MQKCEISKFIFDPLQASPFGEVLAPKGDLRSQIFVDKKFLKFYFRGVSNLCQKSKISKKNKFGEPRPPGWPQIRKLHNIICS